MRIGIVASGGGSAFDSMRRILAHSELGSFEYSVVTDRECGIERVCRETKIPCKRIESPDDREFCERAAKWFDGRGGTDLLLFYFQRGVTPELHTRSLSLKLHGSLYPAADPAPTLERAVRRGARFLGASACLVGDKTDEGRIVAQAVMPIRTDEGMDRLKRCAFVQRVYLSVLLVEMRRQGHFRRDGVGRITLPPELRCTDRCNPRVDSEALWKQLLAFETTQNVQVLEGR